MAGSRARLPTLAMPSESGERTSFARRPPTRRGCRLTSRREHDRQRHEAAPTPCGGGERCSKSCRLVDDAETAFQPEAELPREARDRGDEATRQGQRRLPTVATAAYGRRNEGECRAARAAPPARTAPATHGEIGVEQAPRREERDRPTTGQENSGRAPMFAVCTSERRRGRARRATSSPRRASPAGPRSLATTRGVVGAARRQFRATTKA